MTTRTVEQVGDWNSRSFSGGYRGLQDLSDERFSGIVTAGPTRLCMTKGKVVGVLDGDIGDFEDASGTIHEAPSPALPLLAVMQERTDEVRAQYYTEETPISEVDQTLSDGNFTGFVELSENVLSGDYYIVYHQGRSMNVAWVGESKQLLTEDEAFERTNGEVGIYKVRPVEIDVLDIPEPSGPAPDETETTGPTATDSDTDEASAVDEPDEDDADATSAEPETASSPADDSGAASSDARSPDTASASAEDMADSSVAETGGSSRQEQTGGGQSRTEAQSAAPDSERRRQQDGMAESSPRGQERQQRSQRGSPQSGSPAASQSADSGAGHPSGASETPATGPAGAETRQQDAVGAPETSEAVAGLETRSIPSLDPDRTTTPSESSSGPAPDSQQDGAGRGAQPQPSGRSPDAGRQQTATNARQQSPEPSRAQQTPEERGQSTAGRQQEASRQSGGTAATDDAAGGAGARDELEAELTEREAEIDRLETELEETEDERAELEAELDDVRAERDELQERVENLERRVNELRTEEGGESIADRRRMSPGEVIEGTNLFVRYDSKGAATLEAAYRGNAEPTAVNDNLDIQHHTQFDAEDVAVNGEPFTEFLHGTLQYKFVEWVARVLPYEIRDTGHEGSLSDLYEALPEIDRAELNGTISVVYEEDGEELRSQESFDVVLRDRMGNPLLVANMNESRQPATQSKMETLITASQRVGESKGSLAGSFLVTSSFFDPEAMEAAEDATGSGLLSRDKRESFVKLSRKEGFHLCLVQYLDGQFELSVPEL